MSSEQMSDDIKALMVEMQDSDSEPEVMEEYEAVGDDELEPIKAESPEPAPERIEPKAEDGGDDEGDARPPKGYVKHGALHEERERRKELEARLAAIEASLKPKDEAPKEAPMPDALLEPERFRDWVNDRLGSVSKRQQEMQEEARQQAAQAQLHSRVASLEQEFIAKTPDYGDAFNHLQTARVNELRMMGWGDEQIPQILSADAQALVSNALRAGKNPAEVVYNIAQTRGWKARVEHTEHAIEVASSQMAAKDRARRNTVSLSSASGRAADGDLSLEDIANMPESEVQAMFSGDRQKANARIAKAFGG